jgi:hypothetical protein
MTSHYSQFRECDPYQLPSTLTSENENVSARVLCQRHQRVRKLTRMQLEQQGAVRHATFMSRIYANTVFVRTSIPWDEMQPFSHPD